MAVKRIQIGPDRELTTKKVADIAHNPDLRVSLTPLARSRVAKSRKVVERMVKENKIVYGVTTGFGSLKNKLIDQDRVEELQRNLIRSHSAGVGELLLPEMVRAALVARLNSLTIGYSGVRLTLLEFLGELINRNIVPAVPSQGSVGSSGDLAPLSHMGLLVMGEGRAFYKGKLMSAEEALKRADLKPVGFTAKEGLAWNNGTSVLTGIAALVVDRAEELVEVADMGCALTLEAVQGASDAFDPRIHKLRNHPGQILSAKNILTFVEGSRLVDSVPNRVQDSYSIRCAPQVHGAVRDALQYVVDVVTRELNSVNDNPLIFDRPDRAISGGNFHGESVAITMDTLGIGLSELANISERRVAKLVDASTSEGLPMFLIPPKKAGLHNGFMIPQYVAAALVSENKVLAHPASVDSIPTSANQEDHVSMGNWAARKAWQIAENATSVLAIELLTVAQAIDFRGVEKLGKGTEKIFRKIRRYVPHLTEDKALCEDIEIIRRLIANQDLLG